MEKRIDYTQVIWEITKQLQEAESLEDALRSALKQEDFGMHKCIPYENA